MFFWLKNYGKERPLHLASREVNYLTLTFCVVAEVL